MISATEELLEGIDLYHLSNRFLSDLNSLDCIDYEKEEEKLFKELLSELQGIVDEDIKEKVISPILKHSQALAKVNFACGVKFMRDLIIK